LNILDYDVYFKIIDSLLLEDISSILVQLDDVVQRGFEPDVFLLGLAEHIRNLMVAKDQQTMHLLEISDQLKDRYVEQSYLCNHSLLITSLDLLNECDIHYKSARNKRLHVEIALIKLASVRRVLQTDLAALSIEKKTEITTSSPETKDTQKEKRPEENIASEKEDPLKEIVEEETPGYEKIVTEIAPDPKKDKKDKVRDKLLIGPKLKDTNELVKKVEEEAQVEAGRENLLNHENIMKVWHQYAEISSSPSLKTCMESALVSYASNHIQIIVGSSVARNLIIQESGLIEKIREDLHAKDVTLEVQVDGARNSETEQTVKPRTTQEKYEHLVNKNPLVEKLVKDLQLKPEE
jgi:DNA polymerase III subunit gamma/tau